MTPTLAVNAATLPTVGWLTIIAASLILGTAIGWLAAARRNSRQGAESAGLARQVAHLEGQLGQSEASRERVADELAWQRDHNGELEKQVEPLREAFRGLSEQVALAESRRIRSEAEWAEKISRMTTDFAQASNSVRAEARSLTAALGRTEKRGAWGEMQLRTLVEAAGMLPHVHFVEQDQSTDDSGRALRPDLVVDLAGGRRVIVDSKVPLDAFLRLATEDSPDHGAPADSALDEHGRLVHQHILSLSAKEYWRRYNSPEFVIMFLPSESLLSTALEARPDLIQFGLDRKVLLATPTTLLAMLHTVTHSWREVEVATQARRIQQAGVELYERLVGLANRLDKVGRSLNRTVDDYNALVGSVERRVLVTGRRMRDMGISSDEIPQPAPVTNPPRVLAASDWDDLEDPQQPTAPPDRAADRGVA